MNKFGYSASQWSRAKDEARDAMIECARRRAMITYSDLTVSITAIAFKPDDVELAKLLGEISTEENEAGRGMLTVLVVHKQGDMQPGGGFYSLAERLGRDTTDRVRFWVDELHRVHGYWSTR
jgi:hypothetical protein